DHLLADILIVGHAGYDHAGSGGNDERRNLRDQAVTDGQDRVDLGCLTERQPVLAHADDESADDADHQNQQTGDGIAPHELARTVHGAVKLSLLTDVLAAAAGFVFSDQTGIEIGIDGHLLAGHRVQGKPGADLSDTPCAFRDHHKVDDDQNDEHDQADGKVSTDKEVAKGFNDLARSVWARMTVQEHDPCRSYVQCQAKQRRKQQYGWEG